jgi:ABC-2 type transport system permease protein
MNVLKDTWYIMLRDLRTRIRMPVFIFMSLSQPILFLLLFPQIFKAVGSSGMLGSDVSYLTFFTPGVLVQTVMFSAIFSGMSMIVDMDTGILSRMLATPVTRVSIILGRVIAAVVVILAQSAVMLVIAVIMGVHIQTGFGGVLLIFLLIALIGLGLAAFSNGMALLLKRQEGLMAVVNLITMPLMFLSTMMMPSQVLPSWLNTLRQFNPIDYAIVSIRDLVLQGYVWHDLWRALAVLGSVTAVMVIFATLMFRRRAE